MLLHKSDINMVFANILMYQKSLQDLPGPKCKNYHRRETLKRAWPKTTLYHRVQKWYKGQIFQASSKEVINVEKSLLTRKSNDLQFLNVWALTKNNNSQEIHVKYAESRREVRLHSIRNIYTEKFQHAAMIAQ